MSSDGAADAPLAGRRYVICNWRDSRHPRAGGSEVYCQEVGRQLTWLGADVIFLTSRPSGAPRTEVTDYGRVIRRGGTLTTYPAALAWLARHRRRIDGVIDSENGIPYFSPLAVGRATPVVLLIHHVHQDQFGMYFPPVASAVGRWLEKTGAAWVYGSRPVCAVSPSARAAIRKRLRFRGPVFVVPNGLRRTTDTAGVARSPVARIVCTGRLVPHKRVERLLEAVPRLLPEFPDLQVDIVGDGPGRGRLEELAASLGVESTVRFHGRVEESRRDELVASAWITVNPSAGEGWGLSVIEAAAFGVPAVAFRVDGLRDSVREGITGWLAEPTEELGPWIAKALTAVADPEQAAEWAHACQSWASGFTWERTAAQLLSILTAQSAQLAHGYDERRRRNDTATVVTLDSSQLDDGALGNLRRTDQVRSGPDLVELLLPGADEVDTSQAIKRLGVSRSGGARLARPGDLLGWDVVTQPVGDPPGFAGRPGSHR